MNISFLYNWPPGKDFVRVSFGLGDIEDPAYVFRVGVTPKQEQNKVYWQGLEEWLSDEQIRLVKFGVRCGDKVVVDKRSRATQEIVAHHVWDSSVEWPGNANGNFLVSVPYTF